METVTVSPTFQVVIPRSIREAVGLVPGEKLRIMRYGNRIELMPTKAPREMRGFLKGMDTRIERSPSR